MATQYEMWVEEYEFAASGCTDCGLLMFHLLGDNEPFSTNDA